MLRNAPESFCKQGSTQERPPREGGREGGVETVTTLGAPLPYVPARVVVRKSPSSTIPEAPSQSHSGIPPPLCPVGCSRDTSIFSHTLATTSCPVFAKAVLPASEAPGFSSSSLFSKQGVSPWLSSCPVTCLDACKCLPTPRATLGG